jgi:hypothetical protein
MGETHTKWKAVFLCRMMGRTLEARGPGMIAPRCESHRQLPVIKRPKDGLVRCAAPSEEEESRPFARPMSFFALYVYHETPSAQFEPRGRGGRGGGKDFTASALSPPPSSSSLSSSSSSSASSTSSISAILRHQPCEAPCHALRYCIIIPRMLWALSCQGAWLEPEGETSPGSRDALLLGYTHILTHSLSHTHSLTPTHSFTHTHEGCCETCCGKSSS